jgi:hypothetical protein
MEVNVKCVKLRENALIPSYESLGAAGCDNSLGCDLRPADLKIGSGIEKILCPSKEKS